MKYLRKFPTILDYHAVTIYKPSVSLIAATNSLIYDPLPFDPRYLYSDLSFSSTYDSSKTVIGIEVVPASHTTDNKARFMSVKNMSLTDPETGTVASGSGSVEGAGIYWGASGEVSGMSYIENYPKMLANDGTNLLHELATGEEVDGQMLPADLALSDFGEMSSFAYEYPFYSGILYAAENKLQKILPYPFLENQSKDPLFAQSGTCLADMDGAGNTTKIVAQATFGTTGEINNSYSTGNYPAAMACHRFNAGVQSMSGQWYLPAMGELAYVEANIKKINTKLAVAAADNGKAVCLGMCMSSTFPTDSLGYWLCSSSLYSSGSAWSLNTGSGYVDDNCRDGHDDNRVRAFVALAI